MTTTTHPRLRPPEDGPPTGRPAGRPAGRPGRARRSAGGARPAWHWVAVAVALVVLGSVGGVAASILTPTTDVWALLWATQLREMLVSTVVLMVGVVAGTIVLGGGLAWLTAVHEFPGRRTLSWLLVLPLAVPAWVLGFVALGLLDAPGPVQGVLRTVLGTSGAVFNPRTMPTAIVVFTLALYPYVYLLARAAFGEQGATPYQVARTLGLGPSEAARRVLLPLARPALAAGGALVAMETLTDFATVQYFNVTTVSVGVEQVWHGMYERGAAAELASTVLLIAVLVIGAERLGRGGARYDQRGGGPRLAPVRLDGARGAFATAACVAVVLVAFVVPVVQLAGWSLQRAGDGNGLGLDGRFASSLASSVGLAVATAVACAVLGILLVNAIRFSGMRSTGRWVAVANLGYAMPGPVLAIGTLLLLAGVNAGLEAVGLDGGRALVTGSVGAVLFAYVVRFLALAGNSLDASIQRISPSTTMSALTLGSAPVRVLRRIHLPQLRSGLGIALVLVAVDALKELPIVLLLRPFGFETLSLWVYRSASEARWELAGLPALVIVVVASIPVVTLFRLQLAPAAASPSVASSK